MAPPRNCPGHRQAQREGDRQAAEHDGFPEPARAGDGADGGRDEGRDECPDEQVHVTLSAWKDG